MAPSSIVLATNKERLLIEIDTIHTFIEDDLIEECCVIHHLMSCTKASPEDPCDDCLGFNRLTLSI